MTATNETHATHEQLTPLGLVPAIGIRVTEKEVETLELVPPRKPVLENKLFKSKGGAKLLTPDQDVIRIAMTQEEKLHYFSVASTVEFAEDVESKISDAGFSDLVFEPLIDQVKKDFPDYSQLSFRGGMASINGTQTYEYGHSATIPDVTEIVKNGGDRTDTFNAATANMADETRRIRTEMHRVNQYAHDTVMRRFDIDGDAPEVADTLFPVVSVYDTSKLQKAKGNVWAVQPKEGVTASEALLATYVLDCPVY